MNTDQKIIIVPARALGRYQHHVVRLQGPIGICSIFYVNPRKRRLDDILVSHFAIGCEVDEYELDSPSNMQSVVRDSGHLGSMALHVCIGERMH